MSSRKVLIVEDDLALLKMYQEALSKRGYFVETAADGEDALKKLLADPTIDLIILDILLPRLDGIALLVKLRATDSPLKDMPVIILTNLDDEPTAKQAKSLNVVAFILKLNSTPDTLADCLDQFFCAQRP